MLGVRTFIVDIRVSRTVEPCYINLVSNGVSAWRLMETTRPGEGGEVGSH